jgi:hypothetical protein
VGLGFTSIELNGLLCLHSSTSDITHSLSSSSSRIRSCLVVVFVDADDIDGSDALFFLSEREEIVSRFLSGITKIEERLMIASLPRVA